MLFSPTLKIILTVIFACDIIVYIWLGIGAEVMNIKIGAQMMTVREHCKTTSDFFGSMKKVAEIGYSCVQISMIGEGITAAEIREAGDKYGLEVPLTHTNPIKIRDNTDIVIADHKKMGAKYVGIGSMPDWNGVYGGVDGAARFVADYRPVAQKLRDKGLMLMYHNHSFEYMKLGGKLLMDILIDGIPEMGVTLDVYWVAHGGADPAAWIRKLTGRIDCIHYKDMMMQGTTQKMCEVMEGNLNWPAIFAASKEAGVKYAFVEQDDCNGKDPFECLATSFNNIKKNM